MKITSACFTDGQRIPVECAFCAPDPKTHVTLGQNLSPDIAWAELAPGTRSLVLICHDRDVPSRPDDVNKEGRAISASLPRIDFYHWVLVDIDPASGPIRKGEYSHQVTPKGKGGPAGPRGTRQGINDYSAWFAGDKDMGGDYFGYDGPCPPWNDTIVHHYVFTLYALDVPRCPVEGHFKGGDVIQAMQGHVLASAALTGIYALNPDVQV
jgi:Raf kinase inhibitor-like YbhB/YbcL family protein